MRSAYLFPPLPRPLCPFPAEGTRVGPKRAELGLSARGLQEIVEERPTTIESAHPLMGNRRSVSQYGPLGRLRQIVVVSETDFEASRREVKLSQTFVCCVMVRANPQDLLEQVSRAFGIAAIPRQFCCVEQIRTVIRRQSSVAFRPLGSLAPRGFPLLTPSGAHRQG
jgi:hypothetical protein